MSRNAMTLKSYKTEDRARIAVYEGRHSSGPPNGTVLSFEVTLAKRSEVEPWVVTIQFDSCEAVLPRDAMDRLSAWCARAAETLKRDAAFWNSNEIPLGDYP